METPPIRKIIPKSLDNPDDCKGTKRVSYTEGDLEVGDPAGPFRMKGEGKAADNCKNDDAEVVGTNSHKKQVRFKRIPSKTCTKELCGDFFIKCIFGPQFTLGVKQLNKKGRAYVEALLLIQSEDCNNANVVAGSLKAEYNEKTVLRNITKITVAELIVLAADTSTLSFFFGDTSIGDIINLFTKQREVMDERILKAPDISTRVERDSVDVDLYEQLEMRIYADGRGWNWLGIGSKPNKAAEAHAAVSASHTNIQFQGECFNKNGEATCERKNMHY